MVNASYKCRVCSASQEILCIEFCVHIINWLARPSRTSAETAPSHTTLYIECVGLFKAVAM